LRPSADLRARSAGPAKLVLEQHQAAYHHRDARAGEYEERNTNRQQREAGCHACDANDLAAGHVFTMADSRAPHHVSNPQTIATGCLVCMVIDSTL
jgi:hypothetical protein